MYDYLANPKLLKYIDTLSVAALYIRLIILNKEDQPLQSIEVYL